MTWVAAGTAVAVVGSGIVSARGSEKAAEIGAEGAREGRQITEAAADQARFDVNRLFPLAQQDLLAGAGAAGDILSQGVTEQQRLLSAGNVGAQQTLGQGFGNIQAALLGTPINQQAFAPQGVEVSQPLANPFAQGGQAEGLGGGLFTDLGADRDINAQITAGREGVSNQATDAQRQLLQQGLNAEGRPIGEFEQGRQRELLDQERIARLVNRVGTNQGGQADTAAAQRRLTELGIKPNVARLLNRVQSGQGGAADIGAAIQRLAQLGFTSTGLRG